jgi:hephaestin
MIGRWCRAGLCVAGVTGAALAAGLTVVAIGSSADPAGAAGAGTLRVHYIAADEVDWDYAPSGRNQITGDPFGPTEDVFVQTGPDRIGHVYRKALYREYTDGTFTTLKPVAAKWRHLGVLGPAIHAEVGDTIHVVFKNNTRFGASMHPHGVRYAKDSEGAGYDDGTSAAKKADDDVAPGTMHTYVWEVPDRAGPGPMDPSSVMWMYHSHVDEPGDTNAGLMGPIIVTGRGKARADGSPLDVDREFVNVFSVMDENASPYLRHNIDTFTGDPASVDPDDEGFGESNLMHGINGYVFGNLPLMRMRKGEHVRFYLMGMGTEVDLHTPHWHGNTVAVMGMRSDVAELLPASMKTADMVPDAVGTWLYHCHVNDHITAGMMARYVVE